MTHLAVYTFPGREAVASRYFASAGVDVLCPTVVETRRVWRARRWQLTAQRVAAFPRYLFARASNILWDLIDAAPDHWFDPHLSRHVPLGHLAVVRAGDVPLKVSSEVIALLRNRFAETAKPLSEINAGDRIKLIDGLSATVASVDLSAVGRELRVLLDLLGSRREVTVPLAKLSIAS